MDIDSVQTLEAKCKLTKVGGRVLLVQLVCESPVELDRVRNRVTGSESLKFVPTFSGATFDEVADAIRAETRTFRAVDENTEFELSEDPAEFRHPATLKEQERQIIEATIERQKGSIPKAARELGISPSTIYRKIETWD